MKTTLTALLTLLFITGCSGVETIPADSAQFVATGFSRYAWRSEPLSQTGYSKDKIYQADPVIRTTVDAQLRKLGYQRVDNREQAEFLVDYVAAAGANAGQLSRTASNITPYPSMTINRQVDGASVDNAYALGGIKETGNLMLVFLAASDIDLLWQVRISTLIQDANRVDPDAVKKAILQGLSTLPAAGTTASR
ncbi:MAG: hypothetical protein ACI87W_002901 [Halieaceae bacterium]